MQKELMIKTTSKTYLLRIVFSSFWISYIKDSRFDLNAKIQTRSMEEQTFSTTLKALGKGQCIAIQNLESKEVETDLFFPTISFSPFCLRTLRTKAGRELYISVAHEVAFTFGFPFIGKVSITHPQLFFFYFQQTPIISTF
jgi:hypothetical protein